jgi:O-antigen ligase
MVWVLVVLMIVPEGFDYQLLVDVQAPVSGSPLSRALWLGLLALATAVILWRAALVWLLLRSVNLFLLLFVALAIASIVWSIDPMVTARRDIRLITMVAVCIAFCLAGWHARRLQNVVRPLLTVVLVGSVAFGLAVPSLAIHQELSPELVGAWRGLANHKNTFGALACTALIFGWHGWLAREVRWPSALLGGALAATCLWLSRSSTSAISAAVAILLLLVLMRSPRSMQPYLKYLVAGVTAVLVIYALAILRLVPGLDLLFAPIAQVTGLDMTFTGRSEIWAIIVERIHQDPLLGVGYGAYWTGPVPQSPSYEFIWRMGSFYPGSAHNGYLEVANDLGAAGLAVLLGYIVTHLRQAVRVLAANRAQGALFVVLFIQQAVVNLAESHWLNVLSVQFVITTLVTAALARMLLEQRLRAQFGVPHWQTAPNTVGLLSEPQSVLPSTTGSVT